MNNILGIVWNGLVEYGIVSLGSVRNKNYIRHGAVRLSRVRMGLVMYCKVRINNYIRCGNFWLGAVSLNVVLSALGQVRQGKGL